MYYESGYEAISVEQLKEYIARGMEQAAVPIKYIGGRRNCLRLVGEASEVKKALSYITKSLETCRGGSNEFAMHFMCEELFSVKILRILNVRTKAA